MLALSIAKIFPQVLRGGQFLNRLRKKVVEFCETSAIVMSFKKVLTLSEVTDSFLRPPPKRRSLQSGQGSSTNTSPRGSVVRTSTTPPRDDVPFAPDVRAGNAIEEEKVIRRQINKLKALRTTLQETERFQMMGEKFSRVIDGTSQDPSVVLEIGNFSSAMLYDPKTYFYCGNPWDDHVPLLIDSGEKELMGFQQSANWIQGIVTYMICGTGLRLIISLQVGTTNGWCSIILALSPAETPVDQGLFDDLVGSTPESTFLFRPDKKRRNGSVGRIKDIVVTCGNVWARAKFSGGPHVKMFVDLGSFEETEALAPLPVTNFIQLLLKSRTGDGRTRDRAFALLAAIQEPFVCAVEMGNALGVPLIEPVLHLHRGLRREKDKVQPVIQSFTREAFAIYGCATVQGLVTYQICNTDIRLAVAFCVNSDEKYFAVGFVPQGTSTDSALYEKLVDTNPTDWRSRPDKKFIHAKDGEIFLEIRNVMICAKMSNLDKSLLRVAVTTF